MPKIKIEIDATSEEIVEIFRGLTATKADYTKSAYMKQILKDARSSGSNFSKHNPYKVSRVAKKTTPKKPAKKNPKGQHYRKKNGWTQLEVAWLENWISNKRVTKDIVKSFQKKFGYKRSFSSISNKAFLLRKNKK